MCDPVPCLWLKFYGLQRGEISKLRAIERVFIDFLSRLLLRRWHESAIEDQEE